MRTKFKWEDNAQDSKIIPIGEFTVSQINHIALNNYPLTAYVNLAYCPL